MIGTALEESRVLNQNPQTLCKATLDYVLSRHISVQTYYFSMLYAGKRHQSRGE